MPIVDQAIIGRVHAHGGNRDPVAKGDILERERLEQCRHQVFSPRDTITVVR
ncbi:hypothetical protein D3C80_2022140 [compost metagenome]